ncbi:hypothetical protein CLV35_2883 [Motilibacter peucedani]|uniref:Uncharacterized protein n=1 Tax=Motilibacter peucedani TaxID=598650 RepID=A0A420XMY6_9ACTN|nr:hypothetical protein [Motilibacter peucedani]RKS72636.1 hypothetical protein CLV35_2883 [Motilibacter peucedani]
MSRPPLPLPQALQAATAGGAAMALGFGLLDLLVHHASAAQSLGTALVFGGVSFVGDLGLEGWRAWRVRAASGAK